MSNRFVNMSPDRGPFRISWIHTDSFDEQSAGQLVRKEVCDFELGKGDRQRLACLLVVRIVNRYKARTQPVLSGQPKPTNSSESVTLEFGWRVQLTKCSRCCVPNALRHRRHASRFASRDDPREPIIGSHSSHCETSAVGQRYTAIDHNRFVAFILNWFPCRGIHQPSIRYLVHGSVSQTVKNEGHARISR